jgi:hypothetical protein
MMLKGHGTAVTKIRISGNTIPDHIIWKYDRYLQSNTSVPATIVVDYTLKLDTDG